MATQRKAVSGTVTACVSLSVRTGAKTFVPEDETVNNTNRGTPFVLDALSDQTVSESDI